MTKRFLHISIVWSSAAKPAEQIQPIFEFADDWLYYSANNWIVYTDQDVYTWQNRILAIIDASQDTFFISEIANVHETAGYLPPWVWEWLRKERKEVYLTAPRLRSLVPPRS